MTLHGPLPASIPAPLHDETGVLVERYRIACADTAGASTATPSNDILKAFAASPFIAKYAARCPQIFQDIITSPDVVSPRSHQAFGDMISTALATAKHPAAAQSALRRIRSREFARIAWRDIALDGAIESIMAELSNFADAVLSHAVHWLQEQMAPRFGRAWTAKGEIMQLLVVGLGKLGGNELNFSSDIDLLLVYECAGRTQGGVKDLEHQDYFDRLGRELIALLNEPTADGFVFRVDMRLRPFGESGALTSSLGALEQYYTTHGRDWERYALIKARVICGDPGCKDALDNIIRPFVFRRYLDYGALDTLRDMKSLIDREARSDQLEHDVKRGRGGIREIEFIGQLFQLIRGGREMRLRDHSLLQTLEACGDLGLLETEDVTHLAAAYCFLRKTEHRLQQVDDQQTHALPSDDCGRVRLAFALGYPSWERLSEELNAYRVTTSALFGSLLQEPAPSEPLGSGAVSVWRKLWLGPDDKDAVQRSAQAGGVTFGEAPLTMVLELKSPRFLNRLSAQGRSRFDRLMPKLLEFADAKHISPHTYSKLGQLVGAIARRSVYAAFLADNPDALVRLIELFDASPWIAEQITQHPILMDELLDSRVLYDPPDHVRLRTIIGEKTAGDDLEGDMEALRSCKNQQTLRVAASDVTGQFPVAEVSNQLTYIAEACLAAALKIAWRDLEGRYGEPRCVDQGVARRPGFAIIGYGKLGGWELGYGSDLDLVFIHDSRGSEQETTGEKTLENGVFFTRLAQRLIHILGTTTSAGKAYEVDVRLRPSGASGLLISSADAFDTYQREQAWAWEHQALVRARSITGDDDVMAAFDQIRRRVLAAPRDDDDLKRAIVDMRNRMRSELDRSGTASFDLKQGVGGITDIEFMVQYAVLRWACDHPSLVTWTDNLRLLETIAQLGLWPKMQCRCLHDAYFAFRADIHRRALQQLDGLVDEGELHDHRDAVTKIWNTVFA